MQKTTYYYNQQPFNSYYPNENGYCYDGGVPNNSGSYGDPSPSPPGGDYFPPGQQCGLTPGSNAMGNGDLSPSHYAEQFPAPCAQNMSCSPNLGSGSPNGTSNPKKEIYPWMKENRQTNKRQNSQQQPTPNPQQQQQQQQPSQTTGGVQQQLSNSQQQSNPQTLGGKKINLLFIKWYFAYKSQTLVFAGGFMARLSRITPVCNFNSHNCQPRHKLEIYRLEIALVNHGLRFEDRKHWRAIFLCVRLKTVYVSFNCCPFDTAEQTIL